ncbi:MAG: 3-hydroxyacyl-CoA dehydrogenase NAD-binding domain-containing protein [Burkholderiales bacterium]|nr:3-hydroxyacyl-CoA dehydrogenase NAD-binding domain-containing protein [Burkholderiales bacterium]
MTAASPVKLVVEDGLAWILIDNPPVNATSQPVRAGIAEALASAVADPAVGGIVLACEGSTFVAGADIREFGKPPVPPILPDLLRAIEDSPKPVVAAVHGTALGGGFELAMACHARIAAPGAAMGLPEVKLGLIPGAGGTQRLPRLVGALAALEMITSGRSVKATEALSLGILDAVAPGDLRAEAAALARRLAGTPPRRTLSLPVVPVEPAAFDAAVAKVAARARGQIAPLRAAEAVRLSFSAPAGEGLARERAIFIELVGSPQSAALRHLFFAEREAARVPLLDGAKGRPVLRAGVVGGGTMGAGIAVCFADAGIPVTIVETGAAAVSAARERVSGLYERQVKSGRITADQRDERLGRIAASDSYADLADADLVVEAAFEDMAVKADVFGRLAAATKPDAVLATNTSALDVDAIAAASGRPAAVVGLHFFSPANVMRLVEVVRGAASSREVLATGVALARRLGKLPVVCGNADGFVGNRILALWRQVAEFAVEDGALPHDVDAALEAFGLAMGPFAVSDLAGLDIGWARRKRLAPMRDPAQRYASAVADALCERGRFGQKTGAGWYRYRDGKREVDPEVVALVEAMSARQGIVRRPVAAELIQRRVRAAMVNEGAKILAEGIVANAAAIDLVLVHGYGYPAWRGGPMFEADALGLATVLADMREMQAAYGRGWEPAPLLVSCAEAGRRFADLPPQGPLAG